MKRLPLQAITTLIASVALTGTALADQIVINHSDIGVPTTSLSDFPHILLDTMVGIAGGLSVLYVVIGGLKFVLSSGDAKRITSARNTITYALIGLVVSILAFIAVNFILSNIGAGS